MRSEMLLCSDRQVGGRSTLMLRYCVRTNQTEEYSYVFNSKNQVTHAKDVNVYCDRGRNDCQERVSEISKKSDSSRGRT